MLRNLSFLKVLSSNLPPFLRTGFYILIDFSSIIIQMSIRSSLNSPIIQRKVSKALEETQNKIQQTYYDRIKNLLKYNSKDHQIFDTYELKIHQLCQNYYYSGNVKELMKSMDSLEEQSKNIVCSTLNFSGININPFQYHDGTQEMEQISKIMGQILKKKGQKFTSDQLSVIDKKYKKSKVSVRLGYQFTIDGRLPRKDEYMNLWIEQYKKNRPNSVKGDTEQIINMSAQFQYYCYLTLVKYVYRVDYSPETYEVKGIEKLNSSELIEFLKKYFNRPGTSLQKKAELGINYLKENNLDIMFIQEGGQIEWQDYIPTVNYSRVRNGDSVIIFKKEKFGQVKEDLQQQYKEKLNFNKDTVCYFSQKNNYLLISSHLTSKKHKTQQADEMFNVLNQVMKEHPELKIIVGVDANHNTYHHKENHFNTIPTPQIESTSTKKRTNMQVQFHKAEISVKDIKDQILSNLKIIGSKVCIANGKQVDNELIPNTIHPYDHFILESMIAK